MDKIEKATIYAGAAHAAVGQFRKYTGEPYITHPLAVSRLVQAYGGCDDMIAAAILHDVVEDTAITIDDIRREFQLPIANMVDSLTDVSKKEDGSRAVRKGKDRDHTSAGSYGAQFIKCADMMHNAHSIIEFDKKFAKVFMSEKKQLLDVMYKVKDTDIWRDAQTYVDDYFNGV